MPICGSMAHQYQTGWMHRAQNQPGNKNYPKLGKRKEQAAACLAASFLNNSTKRAANYGKKSKMLTVILYVKR
jgi:hypothetical protein